MDSRFGKEVVVGSIVLAAVAVFGLGMMWLRGKSVGPKDNEVIIQFTDAGELKPASQVRVSGVPSGKVENIKLIEPRKVHVTISLNNKAIVPKIDAKAVIMSVGLAGDVTLMFFPGDSPTPLPKGQVVMGILPPGIMQSAGALSDRADSVLLNVQSITGPQMQERLAKTLEQATKTLESSQKLMITLNDPKHGPSAEMALTMQALRGTLARLDSTLGAPAVIRARDKADTLVGNLSAMSAQFTATGARLDSVLMLVQTGKGTLGKFATDSALYGNMVRLTASLDSLVNDIKQHPGKIGISVRIF
jgi:phospholipid/cholesterol/gamma-HCH transport system substrate-binding protein